MWSSSTQCLFERVPGITVRLILQSPNVKLVAMVLVYSDGGFGNTVWLKLQSYNVKLVVMVLVYSGGGAWEHSLVEISK